MGYRVGDELNRLIVLTFRLLVMVIIIFDEFMLRLID